MIYETKNPAHAKPFPRGLMVLLALVTPACSSAPVGELSVLPPPVARTEAPITAAAGELGEAFASVAEDLRPTVVFIRAEVPIARMASRRVIPQAGAQSSRTSTGTGFIARSDGIVVTNHHVIAGARQVVVRLFDRREYRAEVVGTDATTDIAVLRIPEVGLPAARLGDSDDLRVGEWVIAIGNPLGAALNFSVTAGIVSATARSLPARQGGPADPVDYIQTDAVANAGNSGGPLLDLHGRIMGMNTAIISTSGGYQGYTLAIPTSLVAPVVTELLRRGRLARSGLGVRVDEATVEDAVAVQLDSVHGVVVHDVDLGERLAARAGLRAGDVIMAVNGMAVRRTAQLQRQVWFRRAGDTVQLTVRREGGGESVVAVPLVTLGDGDAAHPVAEETTAPEPCAPNPLGVCVSEVRLGDTATDADGTPRGLLVQHVLSSGPSGGKLAAGVDVITHVNGQAVGCLDDMLAALEGLEPGDIVSVQTYRRRTDERAFNRVRLG